MWSFIQSLVIFINSSLLHPESFTFKSWIGNERRKKQNDYPTLILYDPPFFFLFFLFAPLVLDSLLHCWLAFGEWSVPHLVLKTVKPFNRQGNMSKRASSNTQHTRGYKGLHLYSSLYTHLKSSLTDGRTGYMAPQSWEEASVI